MRKEPINPTAGELAEGLRRNLDLDGVFRILGL